jgi:hypothetical protein
VLALELAPPLGDASAICSLSCRGHHGYRN